MPAGGTREIHLKDVFDVPELQDRKGLFVRKANVKSVKEVIARETLNQIMFCLECQKVPAKTAKALLAYGMCASEIWPLGHQCYL